MNTPARLLLVQASHELRTYTQQLLEEIGLHNVVGCPSAPQALELIAAAKAKKSPFEIVLCHQGEATNALELLRAAEDARVYVISQEDDPRNLSLAASLGLRRILFTPYGKEELAALLEATS